jgi:hypothetical protein
MLQRLAAAARVLRPRSLAHVGKVAAESRRMVDRLGTDVAALQQAYLAQIRQLEAQVAALTRELSDIRLRESQLRVVAQRDGELERRLPELDEVLADNRGADHVRCRIEAATLNLHPFPYIVVDDLLPRRLYDAVIEGIPPSELFADRPVNKRQMLVPFTFGPVYSRRVWQYVAKTIAPCMIAPAARSKFREPMDAWIRSVFGAEVAPRFDAMQLSCSDGRILLRSAGYYIPPHRDPKWGFITCLMYLARPGDDPNFGTNLFSVEEDVEASNAKPHWVSAERCRLEATVELRPNRALIFLNSAGAHGAKIPADAPEGLERYIYQFRIGPGRDQIRTLLECLPPERRALWDGKVADY